MDSQPFQPLNEARTLAQIASDYGVHPNQIGQWRKQLLERLPIVFLERRKATDQGAQFTSAEFTERLLDAGVLVSHDGRGRVFDNIFVERLWRSVKYEHLYLQDYQTVREAKEGLGSHVVFYNTERLHEALGCRTPHEVYLRKERLTTTPARSRSAHLMQPLFLS